MLPATLAFTPSSCIALVGPFRLNPFLLFYILNALPKDTLRCFSACLATSRALQTASDGQTVSTKARPWHDKERPSHSEDCNYSIASLTPPVWLKHPWRSPVCSDEG
eukprot:8689959-Pyramimonas_sp.AAC.1